MGRIFGRFHFGVEKLSRFKDQEIASENFMRFILELLDSIYIKVLAKNTKVRNIKPVTLMMIGTWYLLLNKIQKYLLVYFLGHNQDDTIENIFRNISQGKNYSNLFGMNYLKEERGVLIYRPFLNITKREILAYAKAQGIPYTKDSTPSWSQRGRIRDELVPFLNEFDPYLIPGFNAHVRTFK